MFDICLSFLGPLGPTELIVIGVVGLLIFGNRLPQVGRSLGKGIVEFKKGLKGVEDEIEQASSEKNHESHKES
jgi:sec-independent protein translocase protein TatA